MRRGCLVGGSVANAEATLELHPTVDAECSSHPGSSYPTADTRARVGWAWGPRLVLVGNASASAGAPCLEPRDHAGGDSGDIGIPPVNNLDKMLFPVVADNFRQSGDPRDLGRPRLPAEQTWRGDAALSVICPARDSWLSPLQHFPIFQKETSVASQARALSTCVVFPPATLPLRLDTQAHFDGPLLDFRQRVLDRSSTGLRDDYSKSTSGTARHVLLMWCSRRVAEEFPLGRWHNRRPCCCTLNRRFRSHLFPIFQICIFESICSNLNRVMWDLTL